MLGGQLYSIHPDLIDWDQGVEEWKEDIMGQWPFGIQPTADQRLLEEALKCLDSYLQFEEWEMDQIGAQEEDDDDDDDDDDDVDIVSEDEGYDSEDDDEGDIDQ